LKLQKNGIRALALALGFAIAVSSLSGCGIERKTTVSAPVMSVKYDASGAVEQALDRLAAHPLDKAAILSGVEAVDKVIALTFDGFASPDAMARVLSLLEQHQAGATFFITGMEAAENIDTVLKIAKEGQSIGCGTLYGSTHMEQKSSQELVADLAHAQLILGDILGNAPELLKCRSTVYDDTVLSAASAAGFQYAVQSDKYVGYQSFKDYEAALGYVSRLERGSLLTVRLSGTLDEEEYERHDRDPGKRQPGINVETVDDIEKRMLQVVEWVLKAAQEAGYQVVSPTALKAVQALGLDKETRQAQYQQLRQQNQNRLASQIDMVYTTERAAALTFYGLSHREALDNVLAMMKRLGAQGTFFISEADIKERPDAIKAILDAGHEIGAAILPRQGLDYASVCEQLYVVSDLMKLRFNIDVQLASQVHEAASTEVREAVSAMGLRLVGYSTVVDTSGKRGGAQTLIQTLFKSANYTIRRGQILYFRLDYNELDSGLAAQVLQQLYTGVLKNTANITSGAVYALKGVSRLLNGAGTYIYPVPDNRILPEVRNKIFAGHLQNLTAMEQYRYIHARYIGNPDVSTVNQLPGFAAKEVPMLDMTGKINTKGANVVFLTFDDWGTDRSINQLLDVLQKHQVKATFFIRTAYVNANPNLLRAIGAQGHEIASHTDNHLPLANYVGDNVFEGLTPAQLQALGQDIVLSYQTMQRIVGDMKNERGRPILTTLFRPPTLAVSKKGLETIFDCGYTYSVSGDFSTGDYNAESAQALFERLTQGMAVGGQDKPRQISAGSIVVMHMSDTAVHMPEALDRFLTWNAAQPAGSRFTFARLSDYL